MDKRIGRIADLCSYFFPDQIISASIGGLATIKMDKGEGFPEEFLGLGAKVVVHEEYGIETPYGQIDKLKLLDFNGHPVVRIPGNGKEETPSLQNLAAIFWALKEIGVTQAVGEVQYNSFGEADYLLLPDFASFTQKDRIEMASIAKKTETISIYEEYDKALEEKISFICQRKGVVPNKIYPKHLKYCSPILMVAKEFEVRLAVIAIPLLENSGQENRYLDFSPLVAQILLECFS